MKQTTWQNCYNDSWKGRISDGSFAHPAKAAPGLIKRIFDHAFENGYLEKGSTVVDPFGGVGTTAIEGTIRGVRTVTLELERRFHILSLQNLILHSKGWCCCGDGEPYMRLVRDIVSAEEVTGCIEQTTGNDQRLLFEDMLAEQPEPDQEGGVESELERRGMREFERVRGNQGEREEKTEARSHDGTASRSGNDQGRSCSSHQRRSYGQQAGEPEGDDGIGTYGTSSQSWREQEDKNCDMRDMPRDIQHVYTKAESLLEERMPKGETKTIPKQVSGEEEKTSSGSDVYCLREGIHGEAASGSKEQELLKRLLPRIPEAVLCGKVCQTCGKYITPFPLCLQGDSRKLCEVLGPAMADACVGSPPFANPQTHSRGHIMDTGTPAMRRCKKSYAPAGFVPDDTEGNIGSMPIGDVDTVIGSPPFQGSQQSTDGDFVMNSTDVNPTERKLNTRSYFPAGQDSSGNLAALPSGDVDSIVSSPPFGSSDTKPSKIGTGKPTRDDGDGAGRNKGDYVYGDAEGQLGKADADTFWSAASMIVQQCYEILQPGGVAYFICKDFVRAKQRVHFSDDWRKLCEHHGFQTIEWIKASLVKEERQPGLFGEDIVKRTERKSFFRRIYEQDMPEDDDRRIDNEDVIVLLKPKETAI